MVDKLKIDAYAIAALIVKSNTIQPWRTGKTASLVASEAPLAFYAVPIQVVFVRAAVFALLVDEDSSLYTWALPFGTCSKRSSQAIRSALLASILIAGATLRACVAEVVYQVKVGGGV